MTDDHVFPDREHAAERYLLGEMNDTDRDRYEEHFFGCPDCAEDVRTTAAFLDDARGYVAPAAVTAPRAAVSPFVPSRRPLRSFFWPLPAGAAVAATLLLGVMGVQAFRIAGLQRDLSAERRIQPVTSYFVAAVRSEGPTAIEASPDGKFALRFSWSFKRVFPFYRCEIRDGAGRTIYSEVIPPPPSGDELNLMVPSNLLAPGTYHVTISGLESAAATTSPSEPGEYEFTVKPAGGARRQQ